MLLPNEWGTPNVRSSSPPIPIPVFSSFLPSVPRDVLRIIVGIFRYEGVDRFDC